MLSVKVSTAYAGELEVGGDSVNGYFISHNPPTGKEVLVTESLERDDLEGLAKAIRVLLDSIDGTVS